MFEQAGGVPPVMSSRVRGDGERRCQGGEGLDVGGLVARAVGSPVGGSPSQTTAMAMSATRASEPAERTRLFSVERRCARGATESAYSAVLASATLATAGEGAEPEAAVALVRRPALGVEEGGGRAPAQVQSGGMVFPPQWLQLMSQVWRRSVELSRICRDRGASASAILASATLATASVQARAPMVLVLVVGTNPRCEERPLFVALGSGGVPKV